MRRRAHHLGFSLIEMMIATGIAVVILVGGMSAGVALQRRSSMEEQKMKGQDEMRSAKDFFIGELMRAGTPFGNARIYVSGARPYRYGIRVISNTSPNPFGSGYSGPTGNYAGMDSDYLEIISKASDAQAIYSLTSCVGGAGPSRTGNVICLSGDTGTDTAPWAAGRWVVVSYASDEGMGCLVKIISVAQVGTMSQVTMQLGVDGVEVVGDRCALGGAMWNYVGTTPATATLARVAGFRVNWISGAPVLETSQDVLATTPTWTTVSQQVEQVKITLGVRNLVAPTANTVWFGPASLGAPPPNTITPIDTCETTPDASCVVPGGPAAYDTASAFTLYQQLMRRVQTVDVRIRVRSPLADPDRVQWSAPSVYALDEDNMPRDGFARRSALFHASPRNLSLAGNFNPAP